MSDENILWATLLRKLADELEKGEAVVMQDAITSLPKQEPWKSFTFLNLHLMRKVG